MKIKELLIKLWPGRKLKEIASEYGIEVKREGKQYSGVHKESGFASCGDTPEEAIFNTFEAVILGLQTKLDEVGK